VRYKERMNLPVQSNLNSAKWFVCDNFSGLPSARAGETKQLGGNNQQRKESQYDSNVSSA
jgi:hypothetical protein